MSTVSGYEEDAVFKELVKNRSEDDIKLIGYAFSFAQKAHAGQMRESNEPYFNHVFETAKTLALVGADTKTIAAGFLHDVIEESGVDVKVLEKEFGKEIAFLVEGVTKLEKYEYHGIKRHAESLRKFLIAVSKDIRVLIIKLADRLNNMRTLDHVREDKRKRIALETLEIYAPLAERLGMGQIKGELEDRAFPYVYPEEYAKTETIHKEKSRAATKKLEKIYRTLHKILNEAGIKPKTVDYRVKHLYSTHKKLLKHDMDPDKIYDITALRIIVKDINECYQVLGLVHNRWKPLPGRIKDYIATPKLNGYQSLHTTIFTGDRGIVEIQIRTERMHKEAEFGIAAHLSYKENIDQRAERDASKRLAWVERLAKWQENLEESGEFIENLKINLFDDRVFVFTPKGDVVDLPCGSSPVDFAYAIHSNIGDHLSGAKINNKLSSLETKLDNGDIVEIITKKSATVSPKWLEYAKTPFARKHIKAILQKKA